MRHLFKIAALVLLMLSPSLLFAQEKVQMADWMRSNGRIYVVIAVMLTILAGLILYLVRLDRKMSRIEKEK